MACLVRDRLGLFEFADQRVLFGARLQRGEGRGMQAVREQPLDAAYKDATCVISANMDSDVAREGVDAFFAKRPPNWKD